MNLNHDILSQFEEQGLVLVKYVVSQDFFSSFHHFDRDDLISAGTKGLVQASKTFDPSKCHKPDRFFCKSIKNSIIDFIRKECHFDKDTGRARRIFTFTDYYIHNDYLEEHYAYDQEFYCDSIDKALSHINTLPESYRQVILNYYFREVSHEKLAKEIGIPKTRVFTLLRTGIESLQKQFHKEIV